MIRSCLFLFVLLFANLSNAQISISSTTSPHTQNFNTLRSSSGSSSTLPSGWRLTESGSAANSRYTVDAGSTTTGDTYSYGAVNNTERALGSLQSSSLIPVLGAQFRNTTGRTITSLIISYAGEQWRCGATGRGADRLDFQYSLNASSLTSGTWIDNNTLDFNSVNVTSVGARNGNLTENRSLRAATITGLSIPNNAIFWIRWIDFDASGADDGLAIDDFSIQLSSSDVTPPDIASLNPANNVTGVTINPILSITFNEPIQKGSGNIVVKDFTSGTPLQTIDVSTAAVSTSGSTASFATNLSYNQKVYVEIAAGAFRDLAVNNFAGISGNTTWSFTTVSPPAPASDTLKIVNWNIEWFGGSFGPSDDNLQQQNVQTVLTNINADIYALQEVVSASRLQSVVNQMPGYAMIIGDDFCSNGTQISSCVSAQKLAYIYKTSKVNPTKSYPVLRKGSADAYYNWSSGRFPFLLEADVTLNCATRRMVLVNVHAKANTSDFVISYNRRKAGALELRDSLNVQYGSSNVIVLGDLNDDLDKTITTQIAPDTTTSWIDFKS
ncbi:MAG: Ig-like domain-containing protein, partial [Bacteroidota bacterium]